MVAGVDLRDLTATTVAMMWIKLLGASSTDLKSLHWHLLLTICRLCLFTNIGTVEPFNNQHFKNRNLCFAHCMFFQNDFYAGVFHLRSVPE